MVLDSGFCVLQALIELRKKGVFAAAVVKKRCYWPKHVPGHLIRMRMDRKVIGETESLKGMFLRKLFYNIFS